MKRPALDNRGFSIQEALLTSLIILISISALFRAFVLGTGKVEESGIKRQALTHLEAEMEKVRFYSGNGDYNISPMAFSDKPVELKNRFMQLERSVEAFLSMTITEESQENDLTYQRATGMIRYEYNDITDTLSLSMRVYRNVQ